MGALRRTLGFISLRWKDPSTCEACGGQFTCGATVTGCWCAEVTLTADTRWPAGDFRNIYFKPENLAPTIERIDRLRPVVPRGMTMPEAYKLNARFLRGIFA